MTNAETAALARIRQMADAWEQRLPEVIRTPAVVSALRAVLDAAAPAVVEPPADQSALRDRIRRVLCERDGQGALWGTDMLEPDEYGADADAVLAVLPEPADRAAVPSAAVRKKLRRWAYAAGHIESELDDAVDRMYELIARDVLRRMADETATTETTRVCPPDCPCRAVCIGTRQDDTVHSCPGRWGGPDCRCFDNGPAAGARQDGATQ